MSRRLVRSASDRQEEEDKFDANDDDGDGQLDEAELVEAFAAAGESQELEEPRTFLVFMDHSNF